ncbi:MAG: UPF0758 domain-containing protein, partial [Opitutus sp.]
MPASPDYPATNRLRETAVGERPQERLERFGANALSDTELLAMLLRSGTRGHDVLSLSSALIKEAGTLGSLISWEPAEFQRLKGIGRVKALQLRATMEVARRVIRQQAEDSPILNRADRVRDFLLPLASGLQVEKFWV